MSRPPRFEQKARGSGGIFSLVQGIGSSGTSQRPTKGSATATGTGGGSSLQQQPGAQPHRHGNGSSGGPRSGLVHGNDSSFTADMPPPVFSQSSRAQTAPSRDAVMGGSRKGRRPTPPTGPGSNGQRGTSNQFHKGLVAALHDVLRRQRSGDYYGDGGEGDTGSAPQVSGPPPLPNPHMGTPPADPLGSTGAGRKPPLSSSFGASRPNTTNVPTRHESFTTLPQVSNPAGSTSHGARPGTTSDSTRPSQGQDASPQSVPRPFGSGAPTRASSFGGTNKGGLFSQRPFSRDAVLGSQPGRAPPTKAKSFAGLSNRPGTGSDTASASSSTHGWGFRDDVPRGGAPPSAQGVPQEKMNWAQRKWQGIRERERRAGETSLQDLMHNATSVAMDLGEDEEEDLFGVCGAKLAFTERTEESSRGSIEHSECVVFASIVKAFANFKPTARDSSYYKAEGNRMYQKGEYVAAHHQYTKCTHLDPTNPIPHLNRAAAHYMLMNYDSCIGDCQRALRLSPMHPKALARMAKAYAMLMRFDSAQRYYETALEASATDHELAHRLDRELASLQLLKKSCEFAADGNHVEAMAAVVRAVEFEGEPPVRVKRMHATLHVNPGSARTELTKYFGTLEHPACLGPSDQILLGNVVTHYCDVLTLLARVSFHCGLHYVGIALNYVNQCLDIRPSFANAVTLHRTLVEVDRHVSAANEHVQAKRFDEAFLAFTLSLAVEADSNKVQTALLTSRAAVSLELGNTSAAVADCSRALEIDPTNLKARTRRAGAYERQGEYAKAIVDMEECAKQNGDVVDELADLRRKECEASRQKREDDARQRASSAHRQQQPQHDQASGAHASGNRYTRNSTSSNQRPRGGQPFTQRTLYDVLGVARTATTQSIRQAYRRLTLQYHPDKVVNESHDVRDACLKRFKEISHAYGVLLDATSRNDYDRLMGVTV